MNPVILAQYLIYGLVTLVGLVLAGGSGFLIIRGPLLGGAVLEPAPLMGAAGVFVAGVIVLALGSTKLIRMLFS